jgi:RNA polymerase sigma-70 factor (ECF subfamily)
MAASKPLFADQIESLYVDHSGWLRAWLCKRLGNPGHAEDLAQDTFLKVLRSRVDPEGLHEPRAFLLTVAKRLMLDRSRREMVEAIYLDTLAIRHENTHAESPEHLVILMRTVEKLVEALEHLPLKAQQAFVWHFLESVEQRQVARNLGVSERMVRKYLAQALVCVAQVSA